LYPKASKNHFLPKKDSEPVRPLDLRLWPKMSWLPQACSMRTAAGTVSARTCLNRSHSTRLRGSGVLRESIGRSPPVMISSGRSASDIMCAKHAVMPSVALSSGCT